MSAHFGRNLWSNTEQRKYTEVMKPLASSLDALRKKPMTFVVRSSIFFGPYIALYLIYKGTFP